MIKGFSGMEDNESKQMKYFIMNMYDLVTAYNMWLSRRMITPSDKTGYIASRSRTNLLVDFGPYLPFPASKFDFHFW